MLWVTSLRATLMRIRGPRRGRLQEAPDCRRLALQLDIFWDCEHTRSQSKASYERL